MAYYTNSRFVDDPWAGREVPTTTEWQEQHAGGALPAARALRIEPGFDVEGAGLDLAEIELIKVSFPKFVDGRGYSIGWLLRRRLGFRGELRAVGDILYDQMQLMVRVGFDAFEIVDPATLRLLESGRSISTIDKFYQPGIEPEIPVGTRPWARRSA